MKKKFFFMMALLLSTVGGVKAQQALPYVYGFENNDLGADGWIANVVTRYSGISSNATHSGSFGYRFNYDEKNASLISPLLTGGDKGVVVSFWYKEDSDYYGDEQFQVGYTTDETVNANDFIYGDVITASMAWQQYEKTFPAGTKRIAIKYIFNDTWYLFLDDFSFEAITDNPIPMHVEVEPTHTTACGCPTCNVSLPFVEELI